MKKDTTGLKDDNKMIIVASEPDDCFAHTKYKVIICLMLMHASCSFRDNSVFLFRQRLRQSIEYNEALKHSDQVLSLIFMWRRGDNQCLRSYCTHQI